MKNMAGVMKAVSNRDGTALASMAQPKPAVNAQPSREATAFFNDLFQQLSVVFPAMQIHIKTQSDLDELRKQWITAFKESGISSKAQVEAGMRKARQSESPYLPSPGQFIAWCHEQTAIMVGLPDPEEVMKEFRRYCQDKSLYDSPEAFPWSGDIMYWMCTEMRSAMIERNMTTQEVEKLADRLLKSWVSRLKGGEKIPKPVILITHESTPSTPEKAKEGLALLKATLKAKK